MQSIQNKSQEIKIDFPFIYKAIANRSCLFSFQKLTTMITDKTNGRLDEIRLFATKNNLLDSFNRAFSRFESYSTKGYTVTLYSDFAPLSMEFSLTDNGKPVLNGGFIFHGPHDG